MDFIIQYWELIAGVITALGAVFAGKSFWPYVKAGFKTINIFVSYKQKAPDGLTDKEATALGRDVESAMTAWDSVSSKVEKKVASAA